MSKRDPQTENDVKALVKDWFEGGWSYAPIQTGMGEHGIPDRIGCLPIVIAPEDVGKMFGLFVAVECKRPGRRGEKDRGCTKNQVSNIESIVDAGGVAFVCDRKEDLDYAEDRWSWLR